VNSVIPRISSAHFLRSLRIVIEEPQKRTVEVSFVGAPPAQQIARASGVSRVEIIDGRLLRCIVYGSFQPFLEALHGHEVISLKSSDLIQEG
jgi:hypothetical protein